MVKLIVVCDIDGTLVQTIFGNYAASSPQNVYKPLYDSEEFKQQLNQLIIYPYALMFFKELQKKWGEVYWHFPTGRKNSKYGDITRKLVSKLPISGEKVIEFFPEHMGWDPEGYIHWKEEVLDRIEVKANSLRTPGWYVPVLTFEDDTDVHQRWSCKHAIGCQHHLVPKEETDLWWKLLWVWWKLLWDINFGIVKNVLA
jgi:transposase